MSRKAGGAGIHRRVAELLLGRDLTPDRLDELTGVFRALWKEDRSVLRRAGLVLREARALVRLRRQLRRGRRQPHDRRRQAGRAKRSTREAGMDELMRGVKLSLRGLFRSPVASLAAVVTLALGIGGTTAVFSVADAVLMDPLSFPESDRLVLALQTDREGDRTLFSYENFRDVRSESHTLEALGLFVGNSVAVTGMAEPERIRGEFVTASYFDVLGVEPALGRPIAEGEDVPGGDRTAVLSHRYWELRFGADPDVLGETVMLNNRAHTVVGVMPPDFRSYWDDTDAWISLHTSPRRMDRSSRGFIGVARLADGVDVPTADAELDQIMARLEEAHPEANEGMRASVDGLAEWVVGEERRALVLSLMVAIGFVLLIAVANVANLQLARTAERSREMAIRSAMGGSRRRLALQLLVENLVVAVVGGSAGLAVAVVSLRAVRATFPGFEVFDISLSSAALAVAAALTLGTGVLVGLWPALRQSSVRPVEGLGESGRGGTADRSSGRFRSALIVGQMAMAVTLLVGAGLLLRTMGALNSVDVGFDAEHLLTGETRLTADAYQDPAVHVAYLDQVLDELRTIPGTRGATLVSGMPFSGDGGSIPVRARGSDLTWDQAPAAFTPQVAPGYFDVMDIDVLAGRTFERTDDAGSELVMVVSETLVERVFSGVDPLGRMLETPQGAARIVGVVGDVRRTLTDEIQPTLYLSYRQLPPSLFSVLIRTEGPPGQYERPFKEAFWRADSNQPLWEIMPLEARMASYAGEERFLSALLTTFAVLALLLAGVGLYGVVSHTVGQRTREMGIRLALGADGSRVLRMVLGQGAGLAVLGVGLGLGAAFAVSRLMQSLLWGVSSSDPVTYAGAAAGVAALALLACWVPALRATRVDPTVALKE